MYIVLNMYEGYVYCCRILTYQLSLAILSYGWVSTPPSIHQVRSCLGLRDLPAFYRPYANKLTTACTSPPCYFVQRQEMEATFID